MIEVIPLRIGFRDVKIEGGQLLVNGRPVLIKGANRHEMDPDYGYYVSEGRMLEDIRKSGRSKIIEDVDRDAFAAKSKVVATAMEGRWGKAHLDRVIASIDKQRQR